MIPPIIILSRATSLRAPSCRWREDSIIVEDLGRGSSSMHTNIMSHFYANFPTPRLLVINDRSLTHDIMTLSSCIGWAAITLKFYT